METISLQPFRNWLKEEKRTWSYVQQELGGASWATIEKLKKDGNITSETLARICNTFNLSLDQVAEYPPKAERKR